MAYDEWAAKGVSVVSIDDVLNMACPVPPAPPPATPPESLISQAIDYAQENVEIAMPIVMFFIICAMALVACILPGNTNGDCPCTAVKSSTASPEGVTITTVTGTATTSEA